VSLLNLNSGFHGNDQTICIIVEDLHLRLCLSATSCVLGVWVDSGKCRGKIVPSDFNRVSLGTLGSISTWTTWRTAIGTVVIVFVGTVIVVISIRTIWTVGIKLVIKVLDEFG